MYDGLMPNLDADLLDPPTATKRGIAISLTLSRTHETVIFL
ncbi:MAG: hypothetical protein ACOH2I_12795 [Pseudomonas sp.]